MHQSIGIGTTHVCEATIEIVHLCLERLLVCFIVSFIHYSAWICFHTWKSTVFVCYIVFIWSSFFWFHIAIRQRTQEFCTSCCHHLHDTLQRNQTRIKRACWKLYCTPVLSRFEMYIPVNKPEYKTIETTKEPNHGSVWSGPRTPLHWKAIRSRPNKVSVKSPWINA